MAISGRSFPFRHYPISSAIFAPTGPNVLAETDGRTTVSASMQLSLVATCAGTSTVSGTLSSDVVATCASSSTETATTTNVLTATVAAVSTESLAVTLPLTAVTAGLSGGLADVGSNAVNLIATCSAASLQSAATTYPVSLNLAGISTPVGPLEMSAVATLAAYSTAQASQAMALTAQADARSTETMAIGGVINFTATCAGTSALSTAFNPGGPQAAIGFRVGAPETGWHPGNPI